MDNISTIPSMAPWDTTQKPAEGENKEAISLKNGQEAIERVRDKSNKILLDKFGLRH